MPGSFPGHSAELLFLRSASADGGIAQAFACSIRVRACNLFLLPNVADGCVGDGLRIVVARFDKAFDYRPQSAITDPPVIWGKAFRFAKHGPSNLVRSL